MGLKLYIAKRTTVGFIILFVVLTLNFSIFNLLPGDPFQKYAMNMEAKMTAEDYRKLRELLGLDVPVQERYRLYIGNMLTWNFGESREKPGVVVADEVKTKLTNTLLMMSLATFASISVGTLVGVLIAYKRGSSLDTGATTGALILGSLPIFWLGILILWFFGLQLRWFQAGGAYPTEWLYKGFPTDPVQIILGRLSTVFLPVLTLFIFAVDNWTLLTRQCVLQVITEDYVITARAKGLKERRVLLKHVLKPASLPLVTSMALTFAGIFGGAIITETVFSYDGMGLWIFTAISSNDLPILYTVFYISALLVIIANFMVDLVYGMIDPRIKVGR